MKEYTALNSILPGEKATVKRLGDCGNIRRRLMDIGLTENTTIECVGTSPLGDPCAYLIRGAVIAIRAEDCAEIFVETAGRLNGTY